MKRFALFVAALLSLASVFAVAAQDEPITLRLASWQWEDPAYMPFWEGTTDAFMEANPNVTIERFAFPIVVAAFLLQNPEQPGAKRIVYRVA